MEDRLLGRVLRAARAPELFEALTERLAPTDLQSLLLAVFRTRAARLTPADVLRRYEQSPLVRPATLATGDRRELERLAASLLPPVFEWVEVSTLAPLGTVAALTGLSQDTAVATVRGGEVISDVTNVLALEAALRRRRGAEDVALAAFARVVRPGTHFGLLGLVTSGRAQSSFSFERDALLVHVGFLVRLAAAAGRAPLSVRVTAVDARRSDAAEDVVGALRAEHPNVVVTRNDERAHGRTYYRDVCFELVEGDVQLADGGFVDWTQRLLANAKERLLISGVGFERLSGR